MQSRYGARLRGGCWRASDTRSERQYTRLRRQSGGLSITNFCLQRPGGMLKRSAWTFVEEPAPEPKEGELLVQVLYISLDPAMCMWINHVRSYVPPVGIGELMRALGAGIVTSSRNPHFAVGDQRKDLTSRIEQILPA